MKFEDNNLLEYSGVEFIVSKEFNGITYMKWLTNEHLMANIDGYSTIILGKCDSCNPFYKNSFDGFSYDSVLVVGLGFGLIPQELSQIDNCSKIDVLEISQEIIDYNNTSGHLDSNINLIQGDIHTYTTSEMYDLIIIDTIWSANEMTEEQWANIVTNLSSSLNIGGVIYSPILKKWVTL